MNGGQPLGQGEPFYYQAFYPYFLAAAHALFGEGMFGVVLVQRLLAALTIWKLVEIADEFTDERVWAVALPMATAFMCGSSGPSLRQPLNESLYVPLFVATAASMIRRVEGRRRGARCERRAERARRRSRDRRRCWRGSSCGRHAGWPASALRDAARSSPSSSLTLAVFSLVAIRNGSSPACLRQRRPNSASR